MSNLVYVVDDEDYMRELLSHFVKTCLEENEVKAFNTVDAAIKSYSADGPLLVISDNSTPPGKTKGLEWVYSMRQPDAEDGDKTARDYRPFILAATLYGDDLHSVGSLLRSKHAARFRYIKKPLSIPIFQRYVQEVLSEKAPTS